MAYPTRTTGHADCAFVVLLIPVPVRRSTCTAAEARFAERTDWLGPDPARCFDCPVDPAPAEQ